MKYAQGKLSFGFCDRCGQRFPLKELHYQYINRIETTLRVCAADLDQDHPQLRLDQVRTDDAITLRDPRPDTNLAAQRAFFGWNPVTGLHVNTQLNHVKVTTS